VKNGIPFTTASDAHSHAQLGDNFSRLTEKMSILGIHEVCVFEKHKRKVRLVSRRN
jgi:histidinol-phosphatase (PHP family)